MDSIRIDTGEKRIAINDDPERVIVFNPSDVLFVEAFYALVGTFQAKMSEYQARAVELEASPDNIPARVALLREMCEYCRAEIDVLFGVGTSEIAFGKTLSLEVIRQFFEGITPFVQAVRAEKVAQYSSKPRKAMK